MFALDEDPTAQAGRRRARRAPGAAQGHGTSAA